MTILAEILFHKSKLIARQWTCPPALFSDLTDTFWFRRLLESSQRQKLNPVTRSQSQNSIGTVIRPQNGAKSTDASNLILFTGLHRYCIQPMDPLPSPTMDPSQSLLASRLNHVAISLLEMDQFELAYETFRDAYQDKGNLEEAVKRLRSCKESRALLASSTSTTVGTYSSLFLQILSSTTQSIEITIERAKHKFQRAKSDKTIVNLPVIRFCGNEKGITSEIVRSILAYNMAIAYQAYGLTMRQCTNRARGTYTDHIFHTSFKLMQASDKTVEKLQVSRALGTYQERRCTLLLRLCVLLGVYELAGELSRASRQAVQDLASVQRKLTILAGRHKLSAFAHSPNSPTSTVFSENDALL